MAKFATRAARPLVRQPIVTTGTTRTFEGGAAFTRDARSDLFLLAVSMFVGGDSKFYESGDDRLARMRALVAEVVSEDPDWVRMFVPFLRDSAQMRSASIVAAAEYVAAGGPAGRSIVSAACQRADEPAEMLAYWLSTYGRPIPVAIKRGIADAATRLYTDAAVLRNDGSGGAFRFADVIELVRPKPSTPEQSQLFRWLLDARHHSDEIRTEAPALIAARAALNAMPVDQRRQFLKDSPQAVLDVAVGNLNWVGGWLADGKGLDASFWETYIHRAGYMQVLRNLRNLDEAQVSDKVAEEVAARLANPDQVAKSRQLPIRFLSAYKAVQSLRWGNALEKALTASLANVPKLDGKTLVMVDVSGSMCGGYWGFNDRRGRGAETAPWENAAVFGIALALRANDAEVWSYSTSAMQVDVRTGASILKMVESVRTLSNFGGGTNTVQLAAEINRQRGPFDRIVVLTDEQAFASDRSSHAELDKVPTIITCNLQGYDRAWQPTLPGRVTLGGLTDAHFTAIGLLDRQRSVSWASLFEAEGSTFKRFEVSSGPSACHLAPNPRP